MSALLPPSFRSAEPSLAFSRVRRLRRGINLSHWFSQVYRQPGYVRTHFDHYLRTADIALIREMGFDHVRLPIACEPLLAASQDGRLPADYMGIIADRIAVIHDHRLAVVIDIHPETPFKEQLARDDAAVSAFVSFWEAFAAAFARFDPERTFFEVLNEPCLHDAARWSELQKSAVAAIRRQAPHHTLVICGDQWSQLSELLRISPPDDRNLIANFHLYDPPAFTHQGAGWLPPWARFTKGLTYPADPPVVRQLLEDVADPEARDRLAEYRDGNWNASTYRELLQPALVWAGRQGLPLTCNEFGVYRKFAPRSSRLAWLRDVSSVLSAADIGWTMWDYAGDFAVVNQQDGVRVPDREVLAALGLGSGAVPGDA